MKLGATTITVIDNVVTGDPTGYDGVGNPIYGDPSLTVVNNCSIQQHNTHREINTTDVVVARSRLFAPLGTPLQQTSIVALGAFSSIPLPDGTTTFLVDGQPAIWHRQNGSPHHIECYLREQSG
jgi:hypothetical protein